MAEFDYAGWRCTALKASVALADMDWQAIARQDALCEDCELRSSVAMLCGGVRRVFLLEQSTLVGAPQFGGIPCQKRLALEVDAARKHLLKQCGLPERWAGGDWASWLENLVLEVHCNEFANSREGGPLRVTPYGVTPSGSSTVKGTSLSRSSLKEQSLVLQEGPLRAASKAGGSLRRPALEGGRGVFVAPVAEVVGAMRVLMLGCGVDEAEALMGAVLAAAWQRGADASYVDVTALSRNDDEAWSEAIEEMRGVEFLAVAAWDAWVRPLPREAELIGVLEGRLAAGATMWVRDSGVGIGGREAVERLRATFAGQPWAVRRIKQAEVNG